MSEETTTQAPAKEWLDEAQYQEGEFRQSAEKRKAALKRYKKRIRRNTEEKYCEEASWDVATARDMYIRGCTYKEILSTVYDTITLKPVPVSRLKETIERFHWTPRRVLYKMITEAATKEVIEKTAEVKAAIFEQGRRAGAQEERLESQKPFAERQIDAAEAQALQLMSEGKLQEALAVSTQIERLRKAAQMGKTISKNERMMASAPPPEEEDPEIMRLLDQAVDDSALPALMPWKAMPEDKASGQ